MADERTKLLSSPLDSIKRPLYTEIGGNDEDDWFSTLSLEELRPYETDRFWRQIRIIVAFLICCLFCALMTAVCVTITLAPACSNHGNSTNKIHIPDASNFMRNVTAAPNKML